MDEVVNAGGGGNEAVDSTPDPIELREDSFIKLADQDKPVKFGEYFKGLKGELTRKSQELPRLTQERDKLKRELEELRRGANQRSNPAQNRSDPGQDARGKLLSDLESLQYLNGKQAREVVEKILGQIDGYGQQLQTRDQITGLLLKKLMQVDQQLKGFGKQGTVQKFNELTDSTVKKLGLPQEMKDFAELVYLSHEGDDLNDAFPDLLKENFEKFANAVRAHDRAQAEAARQKPWVPKEGGRGKASKPVREGFKTPREVAKEFHDFQRASKG